MGLDLGQIGGVGYVFQVAVVNWVQWWGLQLVGRFFGCVWCGFALFTIDFSWVEKEHYGFVNVNFMGL